MKNQTDISRQILALADTMAQGVAYIRDKHRQLKPQEAVTVLKDTLEAFAAVEAALQPLLPHLPENTLPANSARLEKAFDTLVTEYETHQGHRGMEILQFNLEPAFNAWKKELDRALTPGVMN